jgi:tetratricopeptide (TPR) repeat protein
MNYIKSLAILLIILVNTSIIAQKIDAERELDTMGKIMVNDLEKAIKYGDSLLKYDFPNKGIIYTQTAFFYSRIHNYEKAKKHFKSAKSFYEKENSEENLCLVLLGLGQTNSLLNEKDKAVKNLLKALKIAKKINNKEIESKTLSTLANLYHLLGNYKKAIAYDKSALIIKEILKDTISIAASYSNIGVFYEKRLMLDSSLFFHRKALELNKLKNNEHRIAISYNNIAKIRVLQKDYNSAIPLFKKSIKLHEKLHKKVLEPYKNLGDVYVKLGRLKLAESSYKKALGLALKTENNEALEFLYNDLLKISIEQKQQMKSLLYQKKKDSINLVNLEKENIEKLNLVNEQYNQAKKEKELMQKIELDKKNRIIYAILLGALLFFILLLYQRNKNLALKFKQEKLQLEQKMFRSQMNPHFIFNTLTTIQKAIFDNDPLDVARYFSRFSKLIRQNFEFISKSEITLEEDLDALKNYIETQQLRFEGKFDYNINIDKNIDIANIKIPPMLLQPFVENSIEHGLRQKKEKGFLKINIFKEPRLLRFEIIDNGVGFYKKKSVEKREHSIDIFLKRLKLRDFGEEKLFSIKSLDNNKGVKVIIILYI